jgi:hypothetical protein
MSMSDPPTSADYAAADARDAATAAQMAGRTASEARALLDRMKVCQTCWAVYMREAEQLHFAWHARNRLP